MFCTDITYFICKGFKVYLSAVIDSPTRKIIAYWVSDSLKIDFAIDILNNINLNAINDEILIHSDQGFHHSSPIFSEWFAKKNIAQSMSRKGKSLDNAQIESFFAHMKGELAYEHYDNMEDLQKIVDEYMVHYN